MKSITSFTHFLIGTLSIFSLLISSQLIGKENRSGCGGGCGCCGCGNEKNEKNEKPVFASFIADFPHRELAAGDTIPFNVTEASKGKAIVLAANNTFTILKSGTYLVSYGVNATKPGSTGGIKLLVNSEGKEKAISTIPVESSQSIIIPLVKGNIVRLTTKDAITLESGNSSTQLSNTGFITFLRVSH